MIRQFIVGIKHEQNKANSQPLSGRKSSAIWLSQRNHRGIDLKAQQIFILHTQPLIDQRAAALRDVNGNRLFVDGLLIAAALTFLCGCFHAGVPAKAPSRLT
jgi:hypothetical protein